MSGYDDGRGTLIHLEGFTIHDAAREGKELFDAVRAGEIEIHTADVAGRPVRLGVAGTRYTTEAIFEEYGDSRIDVRVWLQPKSGLHVKPAVR